MKPLLAPVLPSILVFLALAACSGDDAPGSASSCNELVHDGTTHVVALASNPPTPLFGGVISDGNYVLTAARLFNVPADVNFTRQLGSSLQIRGDVIEQVSQVDGKLERHTFKYTVANTTLSMVDTCASSSAQMNGFEATSTRFEFLSPEPGTAYTLHQVFTKR
jgi:hypothetical protein